MRGKRNVRTSKRLERRTARNGCATKDESDGKRSEERFLICTGGPLRQNEVGKESQPAPFGMTGGAGTALGRQTLGDDEGDVVVLFAGAELADFVHHGGKRSL